MQQLQLLRTACTEVVTPVFFPVLHDPQAGSPDSLSVREGHDNCPFQAMVHALPACNPLDFAPALPCKNLAQLLRSHACFAGIWRRCCRYKMHSTHAARKQEHIDMQN